MRKTEEYAISNIAIPETLEVVEPVSRRAAHEPAVLRHLDAAKQGPAASKPAGAEPLRVPWVSHFGPRFGALERSAPFVTLFKSVVDPLAVAGMLFLICFAVEGEITGLMFCVGVIAFLLAGYLLDGAQLFIRGWPLGRELLGLLAGWLALLGAVVGIGWVSGMSALVDERILVLWAVLTPVALIALHAGVYVLIKRPWGVENEPRRVVIIGATKSGRALAAAMARRPMLRMKFQGYFDDRPPERTGAAPSEFLGRLDEVADYIAANDIRSIYITLPMTSQPRILELLDALRDTTASIYFVPDMFVFDLIQARFDHVAGIPVMSVCDTPFEGFSGLVKRASDLVIASGILLLIWPVLLAIAIGVKVSSPGPIIFRQRRYGVDGKDIVVYKFRSMTVMEDGDEVRQAVRDDQRVTPLGRWLRRTSLDELPQFINVLQGRMSVVGPRPHANAHNEQYRKLINGYMVRHKVRPGITGWAQVNGCRGETDTLDKMARRIEYDLDYLRNWSLWLDIKIVLRTVVTVLNDQAAY